jgi:threonine/homoserine/homoserine lactone efflux protein
MYLPAIAEIWAAAVLVPGPNFIVSVRCALSGDSKSAMGCVAGVSLGTFCWGLAGWLGISALFSAAPYMYAGLKIAGGLYLIWMGWRMLRAARAAAGRDPGDAFVGRLSARNAFRLGLMTNLTNPKSAVFVASLFATALPREASWSDGAAAVAVMVAISAGWYGFVVVVLSRGPVAALYRKGRRLIDAAAGVFFVGFGARLIASSRL